MVEQLLDLWHQALIREISLSNIERCDNIKSNEVPCLTHLICNVKNIGYDDLVPIILHYATDRKIGGYCLQKSHKSIPVRILPEQYLRYDDINFDNLISMKFGELI